jgi:hypothetical protein
MAKTYVAADLTGTGSHARVTVADEQAEAFGGTLADLVAAGVERFGSIDGFAAALGRYNARVRFGA